MKKIFLLFSLAATFAACKKNLEQKNENVVHALNESEYRQGDTTGYSTGNITAYQFQTQEIDLVAGPNNTYTANFAGTTLKFSGMTYPLSWRTGQSAGLFTVQQISQYPVQISNSSPHFSVSGYVETSSGFTEQTVTGTDHITWHIYSTGTTIFIPLTVSGVLIMSQYSASHFAIMPGGYHPKAALPQL